MNFMKGFVFLKRTKDYFPCSICFFIAAKASKSPRVDFSTSCFGLPDPLDFFLGGYGSTKINNQIPFLGYDFLDISGSSFIKTALTFSYPLVKYHYINATANFANADRQVFDFYKLIDRVGYSGYGIGYSYQSDFGPVEFIYSFSSGGKPQILASIGYYF